LQICPARRQELSRKNLLQKELIVMGVDASITLQTLHCIRQDRGSGGSAPFIWPATVWINTGTANVIVVAPASSQARVTLSNGMHNGDSASIPPNVGVITRRFDDDLSKYKLVVTVVLWEKRDLPDGAVTAGFNAFPGALQDAIVANLLGLASTDPTTNAAAVKAVKDSVHQKVQNAIEGALTFAEKIEIKLGTLVPDSVIDNSSTTVSTTLPQSFQITFGNTPDNQSNDYTIDASLQLKPVICEAELNAVNQDQVVVNQLEAQLRQLKTELARAPANQKKEIEQEILDFTKNQLTPAKNKLAKDTAALVACRKAAEAG
jgi:hypothetical protein